MKDLTKFKISETQYLRMVLKPIGKDDCEVCASYDIDYIDEEKNIYISFGYDTISDFCYKIEESGFIQRLIDEKMNLDISIIENLGFEWNQFSKGLQKSNKCFKYHFRGNSHKQIRPYYNSWMYKDKDGNVIFEITPFYPFHYETKKSHPDFITYKQFMKDYKPTIKTIIPKESLNQWIEQAKELEKTYIHTHAGS